MIQDLLELQLLLHSQLFQLVVQIILLIAYGYDCTLDGSGTGTAPATAGCGTATLLLRSVPNGYRDNTVTENITDVRVGFEGVADMMGGMEWELNVQATI